jgi:hypothetical protein
MTNVNESSTPKSQPNDNADRKPPPTREQRELAQAKARTGGSRLAEVAALLRGEEGAGPDDQDDGDLGGDQGGPDDQGAPAPRNGKAPKQPKSLLELSKAVGVPVEELYNLEIPLRVANGDKKTITLADLKDYRDQQDDHQLDRIAWSEEREREHADIARSRAELAELLQMVPEDKLKPEVLNKIRTRHEGMVSLERQRTLRRIPDWHDEGTRAEELQGIAEHLADYGFSANALQGIYDHRMLAYMRDNWLRKRRLSAALEKVKPVRTETPSRSRAATRKTQSDSSVRPSTGPRTMERQVAQVSQLLRGD